VTGQVGNLGQVVAVGVVGVQSEFGSTQFIFVTADDRILHTTRNSTSETWAPVGDVKGQVGDFGTANAVAAVSSAPATSQFFFATIDGRAYHTTRKPDGSWWPAGLVKGQIGDIGQVGPIGAASSSGSVADYLMATYDPTPTGPT
jgi:hypothetical protein